jgi:hypothetical protein
MLHFLGLQKLSFRDAHSREMHGRASQQRQFSQRLIADACVFISVKEKVAELCPQINGISAHVKLILRPMVCMPVVLVSVHHLGTMIKISLLSLEIIFKQLLVCCGGTR